jgi:hypothetical protein
MYLKILLCLSILFGLSANSFAQRSVGEVKKDDKIADENLADIPPKKWLGKKFIFLEMSKMLQEFGYDLHLSKNWYSSRSINPELERSPTYNLLYDKFVGKVIQVIEIEDKSFDPIISFRVEGSEMMVYGKPYKGYLDGIAPFDDLDKAKAKWLGKTIYSKVRSILTYDAQADKYGQVKIRIPVPLKVNDVWWGLRSTDPLWLIVETPEGEKGAIATAFSWTNIYNDRWKESRPWEDKFFEENPRVKFKWTEEDWNLINDGKIKLGMTKEQVQLSWGKPKKLNEDIYQGAVREQWIYDSQYLYFENDKLTAMQNR